LKRKVVNTDQFPENKDFLIALMKGDEEIKNAMFSLKSFLTEEPIEKIAQDFKEKYPR